MLLNFGAAAGRASVGFVADRIGPVNALLISVGISGLAQLLIWNFVNTYSGIVRTAPSPGPLPAPVAVQSYAYIRALLTTHRSRSGSYTASSAGASSR